MTFYTADLTVSFQPAVKSFITAVAPRFSTGVTFTVPNEGDLIEDETGALGGSWTEGTAATVSGSSNFVFAAPAGAVINWSTTAVVGRRRLRGRTFLVPLSAQNFDSDGSLAAAAVTDLRNLASTLWVAAALSIWHRPTTPGGSDGSSSPVTGSNVPDKAAVLRSRRA